MHATRYRRGVLHGGPAVMLLAFALFGTTAAAGFTAEPLSPNVALIHGAGTNVVVLRTDEGLVLAGGGAAGHGEALAEFLRTEFGNLPVVALFTLHWRPQHTGANALFAEGGASIYAHENTRLWMGTEYYVEWERKNHRPQPVSALPTDTFRSSDPQPLTVTVGDQRIHYGHLAEAYTDGDIYVHFVDEGVIAVGEVLGVDTWPVPDYATGGWIGGLQDATQLLINLADDGTHVVAAHGPVQTRAALIAQAAMLDEMHERIRIRMNAARSVEEILADDVAAGYETYGDPARFVANIYGGLWWGGRLRGAY